MRVFKPRNVGLLYRTVERAQRYHFCVAGLLYVPLTHPRTLLPEAQMWKAIPKLLGKDAVLDEMVAKTHGEVLVAGAIHTPDATPQPVCVARVQVGPVDKRIVAIGDRQWKRGAPTDPVPFTEMPVSWERAFGGPGFPGNPLGKGHAPVEGPDGKVHPLPNLEYPDRLIRNPGDRPAPACFLPLDLTWPERWKKAGTYGRNYLETDFPGLARDADWTMFNAASADQWAPDHFAGDDAFVLENLHPEKRRIEGRLPGAAVRVLIVRKGESPDAPTSLPMRLETIWLFPNVERAVLVYRGVTDVSEDDADDLAYLMIGCEDASAPKPLEHYRDAIAARLDEERAMEAMQREEDLLPAWPPEDFPELDDGMAALKFEGHATDNQFRKMEREALKSRATVASFGLDPDKHGPKVIGPPRKKGDPPPKREETERQFKELQAKVHDATAAGRIRRREKFEKLGLDYSVIEKESDALPAGPPKPRGDAQLQFLQSLVVKSEAQGVPLPDIVELLDNKRFRAQLGALDDAQRDAYRQTAHLRGVPPRLEAGESERLRTEVARRRAEGLPVRDLDFTGADLAGVDFEGVDLERAFLECAVLRGANLRGANLREAVLTRADLEGADLEGANLEGANLGECQGAQASLRACCLKRAILTRANLDGAVLDGADLAEADLTDGRFGRASLRKVRARGSTFFRANLVGLELGDADLERVNFFESDLTGANFVGARLASAGFTGTKVDGADFARADLTKASMQLDSSAVGASFVGAQAAEANFRGTRLDGADFTGACLRSADFSTCSLQRSKFVRADAARARFVRAHLEGADLTGIDLMEGVLQKAHLEGATLDEANLFQADLSLIWGSPETTSKGANFTRTRVHPLRKKS